MPVTAIVGANWGDEGKGKTTDYLAARADFVVRFQGAKRTAPIADLCNVDLTSPLGGVQTGSLSPWVPAPTDLNSFFPLADMVRWVIVFDRTAPFADQVLGVTNLRIEVQPE